MKYQFIPMKELLAEAKVGRFAVPAFCAWNAEALHTILEVAENLHAPVIVMSSPPEHRVLSPDVFARMAREIASSFHIPVALHLDHGDSLELVRSAIEAGYSSVMLDYSSRPFAENAEALRTVVGLARPKGVTVEGEIGHVGTADSVTAESKGDSSLTTPEEAAKYVEFTGVDAVAVSIGNAHGQYTRLPKLDFERLAAINAVIKEALVLHGGSGTPDADLKRVIALGISKVNVATELVAAWRESLRTQWDAKQNLWAPLAIAEALKTVRVPVERWIKLTGAAGRA